MLCGAPCGAGLDGSGVEGLSNSQLFEEGERTAKFVGERLVSSADVGEDVQLVGVVPVLLGDEKTRRVRIRGGRFESIR